MLIEQIIEFKSRVPGLLVVHIFLKLVIFMTKQKPSKANLRVHYLMLKMLLKAMYLDFPDLGQVTKFNPKILPIQNSGYAYALNHVQYAYQIPVIAS